MFHTSLKINLQRTLRPLKREVFSYSRMLVNNCKHLINFIVQQFSVILYKKKRKKKNTARKSSQQKFENFRYTHARDNFNLRQRCETYQHQSLSTRARKIVLISALSNSLKKKKEKKRNNRKSKIESKSTDANQSQLSCVWNHNDVEKG